MTIEDDSNKRLLASAVSRLARIRREEAFDPIHLNSRPTAKQQQVINEFGKVGQQWIRAGNQCLAEGTLVATPQGPVPIEQIMPGDIVYSEHGTEIKVCTVFNNDVKQVADLTYKGKVWATCTPEHVFLVQTPTGALVEKQVKDLGKRDKICLVSYYGLNETQGIRLKYGANPRLVPTHDLGVISPTNLYLLANGLVTHNSGKSAVCARICTWFATNTHPSWKHPADWENEPILIIVAGRTGKQIENSLLPKLKGYLEPGTYKEVRIGSIIQQLELNNGNKIVFQSLENPASAQKRLQSYVAHLVWIDELPPTLDIVRELLVRVQARSGYFLASFTPTSINIDIQRYVDSLVEPEGVVYRFNMLDNPLYSDPKRREELISRYAMLPEHIRNAIFEGEWLQADDLVYQFSYSQMVRELPEHYSRAWRHVESVDPALKSALGLTLWAEDPMDNKWYCVFSDYIKGISVPTLMIEEVARKTAGFNIIRRISDYAPWFTEQARAQYNRVYTTVDSKNQNRKADLIKQLQQVLASGNFYLTPNCSSLIEEIQSCRWAPRGGIINGQSYHLLDSAQYFADNVPKAEKATIAQFTGETWTHWLKAGNEKRKKDEYNNKLKVIRKGIKRAQRGARGKGSKWIQPRWPI